jgi:hypothetical protein
MEGLMTERAIERLRGLISAHAAKEQKVASDAVESAAAHAAKERKAASQAAGKASADFERMREFLAFRDTVIAPIATAFAKQLVASGHRARAEATDCTPQTLYAAAVPGRFVFALGLDAVPETSTLTFIGYPDCVHVHVDYHFPERRTTSFGSSREFPRTALTQKVVEDIFLDFVSKVLDLPDL